MRNSHGVVRCTLIGLILTSGACSAPHGRSGGGSSRRVSPRGGVGSAVDAHRLREPGGQPLPRPQRPSVAEVQSGRPFRRLSVRVRATRRQGRRMAGERRECFRWAACTTDRRLRERSRSASTPFGRRPSLPAIRACIWRRDVNRRGRRTATSGSHTGRPWPIRPGEHRSAATAWRPA